MALLSLVRQFCAYTGFKIIFRYILSPSYFVHSNGMLFSLFLSFFFRMEYILSLTQKGEVVLVLNWLSATPWRRVGSGGIVVAFVTSALDGGEWSVSLPCRFIPGERAPGTYWIGGWVGLRASLDAKEERRISCPFRESNPGRPTRSTVAVPSELSRLPYLFPFRKKKRHCFWAPLLMYNSC
jgi:hypothetical protein